MENKNDKAVQIGLVALLLVQYLFPLSLMAPMFLESGDWLSRESIKKAPAKLSELT